jgi:hypothetical protein
LFSCQLMISLRNCNTGKSKLMMTRSLNGFTTRSWVDLIIICFCFLVGGGEVEFHKKFKDPC